MTNVKNFNVENDFDMALFVKFIANQLGVKPKTCWDNYMRNDMKEGRSWKNINMYIKKLEGKRVILE